MSTGLSIRAKHVRPSSTLAITDKAKRMKADGLDVVSFGAGEPDFPTPANICEAGKKAIDDGFTKYTAASGTVELKKAVCDKFKRFNGLDYEPKQIVISNGGKHSLTNIFTAIINPGEEVVIPAPFWLSYPEMVRLAGGVPVIVKCDRENNYKITPEQLKNACNDRTKAFVLNNPNNPTGMVYTKAELSELAKIIVEEDIYCVSDEMYENIVYGDERPVSIASFNKEIYDRTITCSGLAKAYSMTGWRIGYTGSAPEIAKAMGAIQSHQTSNPNSIAQKAALEALNGPQDAVETMRQEFEKRNEYMYERISKMPHISMVKPMGAFYAFVDVSDTFELDYRGLRVHNVFEFARILLDDYYCAVVPCTDFGFDTHIRLSYATSMENIKKGLDRIEEFLKGLDDVDYV
ncbi:MAG: pyridoxal phosphate-dependent aminotransferase [Lachnospiraceae bacterium]|nr:pyridoxal phosphate-dependent aminotransferase [Lachnospiraceae bacterium]